MSPLMNHEQLERQLNRLVDGELSGAEYQRLLESLESAPDGWRRCALAFLESQALSRDLVGVARDPAPRWSAMLAAANAPATPVESSPPRSTAREGERPTNTTANSRAAAVMSSTRVWRLSPAVRWAALAASWLVVFGVGWGLNGSAPRGASPRGVWRAEPQQVNVAGAPALSGRPLAPRESIPTRVPGGRFPTGVDEPTGVSQGAGMGGSAEQLVDAYVPPEYRLPPADIREDVRARGIDVREREMYLPLQLEGGKNYVVPVREYKVAPWKRPAY